MPFNNKITEGKWIYRNGIRMIIFMACFSFTIWQCIKCCQKYNEKPQGTKLSIEDPTNEIFPALTICPLGKEYGYNETILSNCGIGNPESYNFEGFWAKELLNGSEMNCSDPKLLNDKILPKVEDVIESIHYRFLDDIEPMTFQKNDIKNISKPMEVQEHNGRCFTILTPTKIQKMKISVMRIHFFARSMVILHTPKFIRGAKKSKSFKKWDFRFKRIIMNPKSDQRRHSHYNLEYEIVEMLDYRGFPCISDDEYDVDECMDKEIYNISKRQLGCTTPFTEFKDNICKNQSIGLKAQDLLWEYDQSTNKSCKFPCKILVIRYSKEGESTDKKPHPVDGKEVAILNLKFEDMVKKIQGYYLYSFLSLIAEIGGYVGLFLGVSFYQITEIVDHFF